MPTTEEEQFARDVLDILLSWSTVNDDGHHVPAPKLMPHAVDPATLDATRRYGRLIARLTLTDAHGDPMSGAVRPSLITWSAGTVG
jgi:Family of unknown function (DUF5990)